MTGAVNGGQQRAGLLPAQWVCSFHSVTLPAPWGQVTDQGQTHSMSEQHGGWVGPCPLQGRAFGEERGRLSGPRSRTNRVNNVLSLLLTGKSQDSLSSPSEKETQENSRDKDREKGDPEELPALLTVFQILAPAPHEVHLEFLCSDPERCPSDLTIHSGGHRVGLWGLGRGSLFRIVPFPCQNPRDATKMLTSFLIK